MAKKLAIKPLKSLHYEELEQRVLFSADVAPVMDPVAVEAQMEAQNETDDVQTEHDVDAEASDQVAAEPRWELVFVNDNVADFEQLIADLQGNDDNRIIEVVGIESDRDGIEQVSEILADRTDLSAVHFITHGADGQISLGDSWLNSTTLQQNSDAVAGWGSALTESGDILFYGCDIAADSDGQTLLGSIAGLTGADVAASDDITGSAEKGGDWDLEFQNGNLESQILFSESLQERWDATLDISNGLQAHLTFDAGQGAQDSSGNNLDGTLIGDAAVDTTPATNQFGDGKLILDGTDDYVDMDAHAGTMATFTEGTISAWINFSSTADQTIFTLGDGPANSDFTSFHVENGNLRWDVSDNGGYTVTAVSTATYNDSNWHHVAVTVGPSGTSLWVDGTELTGGAVNYFPGSAASTDFFADLTGLIQSEIGAYDIGSGPEGEFSGLIDDFRIYDRALTAGDIAELQVSNDAPTMVNWFNDAWDSRKELTIEAASVAGDLTGFPVLITLNTDADLAAQALANGDDILFTAADGVTQLAHEIEYFNETTGELRVWVKTDLSASVDTDIYVYFGNAASSNQENVPGVWDNYVGVYHLSESPTGAPGELIDSSGSGNHATTEGAMDASDSVATTIGQGLAFDGSNDMIRIPDSPTLDSINDEATFSLWINFVDSADGDTQIIMSSSNRYSGWDGYEWAQQGNGDHFFYPDAMMPDTNYNLGADPFTNSTWHHLAATMDFATKEVKIYVDGSPMTFTTEGVPGSWSSLTSSDDLLWGGNPDRATRYFLGMMDEIRIADVARTQEWIQTEVNNQSAPAVFFSVSMTESRQDRLTDINEDDFNSAGNTVLSIINSSGADRIMDIDSGAVEGIAVVTVDDTNGEWQYDANADGTWVAFGVVTANNAVLLDTSALIRFVPDADYNGSAGDLIFHAWDQTSGANGNTGFDVSSNGGSTAFSSETFAASLDVIAVNDNPVITSNGGGATADINVAENTIAVTTVTATDVDLDTLTYSISGGADAALFNINSSTGELNFISAPNFENPLDAGTNTIYEVTVRAADGNGGEDTQAISVTVTDALELAVTNTNATGTGSLHEAILNANANTGVTDTITFNIPGAGPHVISLTGALPSITDTVIIDGTTEPDYAGKPIIVLDGSSAGAGISGITLHAGSDGSGIRGLVINQFAHSGIRVDGSDSNTITGNYIGTDASGNTQAGGDVQATGITIQNSSGNVIGGSGSDSNVLSGNRLRGLLIDGSTSTGNTVLGNFIGTNADGSAALTNIGSGQQIGVYLNDAPGNTIGGTTAGAENIISGNITYGIYAWGPNSSGNEIQGNTIGLDASHSIAIGNGNAGGGGIMLSNAPGNIIGGTVAGAANVISGHLGAGVLIAGSSGTGNAVLRNAIYDNGALGIDLGSDGVTANDADDADTGANNLQNFPVLTSAVTDEGTTITIDGSLNTNGLNQDYRIEFFASTSQDGSGYGEAGRYLGFTAVTTDGSGNVTFSETLSVVVAAGEYITVTASVDLGAGSYGDTSEFALNIVAAVVDTNSPTLVNSTGSTVTEGGTDTITNSELRYDDQQAATNVTFSVTNSPLYGRLEFVSAPGAPITSFTQDDVDNNRVVYVHNGSETISDLFDFSVDDGLGNILVGQSFAITITPINDSPIAVADSFTVDEGSTTNIDLAANDSDADDGLNLSSIAIVSGPTNGSIVVNADGTVDYTHDGSETVADSFTYTINDLTGATSNTVTVSLTITPVNDAPIDLLTTATTDGGINLNDDGGNDTYLVADNGGALLSGLTTVTIETTFSISTPAGDVTPLISYADGTNDEELGLFIKNDGRIWFMAHSPGAPYQSTAGSYPQLFDGEVHHVGVSWDASSGAVAFYVDGQQVETFSGYQTSQTITGSGELVFGQDQDSILGGFSTADVFSGSLYDVRIFDDVRTAPEIAANYDQTLPNTEPGMIANWTFNDLSMGVVLETVSGNNLTEQHVTGPGFTASTPELSLEVREDALDGTVIGSLTAVDPDSGDTFTYTLLDDAGGRFSINALNGQITVVDSSLVDFESTTSHNITARVTDSGGLTYDEVFTINVLDVNDAPIAVADSFTVDEGSTTNLDLAANDTDADDGLDLSSITIVSSAANGSIVVNADGTVDYTHDGSETVADSFTYTIDDLAGATSNTVTVSLTITPVNDPPVARDDRIGLVFDGVDDYVRIGDYPGLIVTNNLTMEAWIKPTGLGSGSQIIINKEGEYELGITAETGEIKWAFDNSDPDWSWHNTGYFAQAGEWTHLAVTYDSGVANTYANGVLVDTYNGSGVLGDSYPIFNELRIGGRENATTQRFNGQIDEVCIWNTTRTQVDIQNDMNALLTGAEPGLIGNWRFDEGTGTIVVDQSALGHNGTLADGVTAGEMPVWQGYVVNEDSTLNVSAANGVLANDFDVEGDPLTAFQVSGPSNASAFTLNADGSFTYTPVENFYGIDSFTYRANDGSADSNIATATIRVEPINDAPVSVADSFTVNEGSTTNLDLAANDTDVDDGLDLTGIAVVSGPSNGAIVVNADGTVDYTHDGSETVADSFTYTIDDLAGATSNTVTVSLTITPVNDAPIAVADGFTVNEGSTTNLDLAANDTDADDGLDLTSIAIVSGPANGSIVVNADGTVDYTHDGSETVADSFTYTIDDDIAGATSNTVTVSLTVTPINDAPIAVADNFTVDESSTTNLDLAANDTDADDGIDLSSITIVSGPANGSIVVNADGTIDYTHDGSETVADSFTYTIDDIAGATSNTVTVSLTITPVNDAPIATADSFTVDEGSTTILDLAANDTDADDGLDLASITIVSDPTNGSIVVNADGTVDYTHDGSETIVDSFTYTIDDLAGATSNTVTVSLTITPVNDAPIAVADSFTVNEGSTTNLDLATNDTDADDGLDLTRIAIVSGPANGSIVVNADGTVDYTHDGSGTVADSFTYTIDDLTGATSNTVTVSLTVTPVNDAPIAVADNFTVDEGSTTNLDLAANDTDADDGLDLTSIAIVSGPANGFIVVNADGTVDYTHDGSETVADSFTYTIDDLAGATSNTVTVSLTITPINDAPIAVADNFTVNEDSITNLDLATNDTDADDGVDLSSIAIVSGPTNGSLVVNADGSVDYTHDGSETIADSFTYTIDDLAGATSNTVTVSLTITPVNDAPIAVADSFTVDEGSTANLDLAANDTDADDGLDLSSITIISGPSNGSIVVNADGTVDYTHDGSETIADSFTYTIDDVAGATSNTITVSLTITPINDAPIATADGFTVDEGSTTNLDLAANDTDADDGLDLTSIAIVSGPTNGSIVINVDGTVDYTHDGSETIADSFTYTIDDLAGATSNTVTVSLTITPINDAPIAVADGFTVNEGSTTNLDLAANDTDADDGLDLTSIAIVTGSANGSIVVNADGTVDYTHDGSETVADSFTYTIDDLAGSTSSTVTVSLTITPVNDAPIAVADSFTVNEGSTTTLNLAANDTDADDGLDLTRIAIVSGPANGSIVVNADGTVDYTHDGSETVADSFTYTIDDLSGATSNTVTVTLTITPVNDAPIAVADSFTVNEGSTTNLDLATNDTDADDGLDLASINIVTGPTNGSIVLNADGTVDYTHDGSETIADSFTYTIDDLSGAISNTVTVSLTITPVNDAPIAVADSFTVNEGSTTNLNLAANDTDADDGLDLTGIVIVSGPANGSIVVNAGGTVDYTHDGSETVVDSFTYTIDDIAGTTSNTVTVSLTITPVNDAPIFTSSALTSGTEDTAYNYTITTSDNDGDSVAISTTTLPAWLTLVDNGDGTASLSGTPTSGQVGDHMVVLQVSDGVLTGAQSFTLSVSEADSPDDDPDPVDTTDPDPIDDNPDPDEIPDPGEEDSIFEDPIIEDEPLPIEEEYLTPPDDSGADDPLVYMEDTEEESEEIIFLSDEDDTDMNPHGRSDDRSYIFFDHELSKDISPSRYLNINFPVSENPSISDSKTDFNLFEFDSEDSDQIVVNSDYDFLRQEIDDSFSAELKSQAVKAKIVTITAASFTAGFVSYLLRAGSMIASFMSVLPAWRGLDPLVVFSRDKKRQKKEIPDKVEPISETLFDGEVE